MLVEAAWAAAKAPGPLRGFFIRVRAERGHQIAAVAVARKLAVLCWHMLTNGENYRWARPSLVAHKRRAMELAAGKPQKKGNARGPAYAYNVKALRNQEMEIAERAQESYEHFVAAWAPASLGRGKPDRRCRHRQACGRLTSAGTGWAARRRFQPTRRASPRGRPHDRTVARPSKRVLSMSSVV